MTATRLNPVYASASHTHAASTITNLGTVVTKDCGSTATATSTGKSIGSVSLAAGTWIVVGTAWFAANATGRRYVKLSPTSGDIGTGQAFAALSPSGFSSGNPATTVVRVVELSATTSIHLNVWQNSGGNLNAAGYIAALRIK